MVVNRYGYRRVAALLRAAGWPVNDKRVERLWRREGLKVPGKHPKRGRLWLNDGSCVRLRAEHADHVSSYDFVHHRTHEGWAFRTLNVLDECTRESLHQRPEFQQRTGHPRASRHPAIPVDPRCSRVQNFCRRSPGRPG